MLSYMEKLSIFSTDCFTIVEKNCEMRFLTFSTVGAAASRQKVSEQKRYDEWQAPNEGTLFPPSCVEGGKGIFPPISWSHSSCRFVPVNFRAAGSRPYDFLFSTKKFHSLITNCGEFFAVFQEGQGIGLWYILIFRVIESDFTGITLVFHRSSTVIHKNYPQLWKQLWIIPGIFENYLFCR